MRRRARLITGPQWCFDVCIQGYILKLNPSSSGLFQNLVFVRGVWNSSDRRTWRLYRCSCFLFWYASRQSQPPWVHLHVVEMSRFMSDINQPSLRTPFLKKSVLVSISVFITFSTVFRSIKSPDNSPFSHSVLPVLSLPYWSFQLYISLWKSPSACGWLGSKYQLTN